MIRGKKAAKLQGDVRVTDNPVTLPLVWTKAASIESLSPGADVSIDA